MTADLRAVVVIPARDEESRIGGCLEALGNQTGVPAHAVEIIVVTDRCVDRTAEVALAASEHLAAAVSIVESPAPGVGHARRHGMEIACLRLDERGAADGLIACTDADTIVDPTWLVEQLRLVRDGAEAIGGEIALDAGEATGLDPRTIALRQTRARTRLANVRAADPDAEHHFFSGASMAVTVAAYRRAGGLDPRLALEDEAFNRKLDEAGVRVQRSSSVRVTTSARTHGRASRGLAADLKRGEWFVKRRYDGRCYTSAELLRLKQDATISVVIPTRDCADTIAHVLDQTVLPFAAEGLIDEVVVVDGSDDDRTADAARAAGAHVHDQDALLAQFGPALGKGDAMWRALSVTDGDVVAYLDGDTLDPVPCHLLGLLGPLLSDPGVQLVKGAFERPFRDENGVRPSDGGRVTELMARPLLNLHVPELAGFTQPLAGETAARRTLLERLAFPAGYGVETAMLIDSLAEVGLDGLAESWLGTRQNTHQSLRELGAMAFSIAVAVERRVRRADAAIAAGLVLPWENGDVRDVPVVERPPYGQLGLSNRLGIASAM